MNRNRRTAPSNSTSSQHMFSSQNRPRRGVITVFAAFLMILMLAMVAFAVDVGYMMVSQAQLQIAADSAAMAAASNMSGTQAQMTTAAQTYGGYNKAAGKSVSIANSD